MHSSLQVSRQKRSRAFPVAASTSYSRGLFNAFILVTTGSLPAFFLRSFSTFWRFFTIWGDHSSPISDTAVPSATATNCPHVAHVKTQIPYALLAMAAAGVAGYLGIALGAPIWIAYLSGIGILIGGLLAFGGNPEEVGNG